MGIENVLGYQKLKLLLSDMEKANCKKIEIEHETLLKLFYEMQNLKYQKNLLLDEIDRLKSVEVNHQTTEVDQGIQIFLIIKDLLRDLKYKGAWIEFKNKTVHTKEYYRIEKETLEKSVEEKASGIDTKKLLDMMANFGILRKEDDKILFSATVDGVPKRIYMIRINSVNFSD